MRDTSSLSSLAGRVMLFVTMVAAVVASYTLLLTANEPPNVRFFCVISAVVVGAPSIESV